MAKRKFEKHELILVNESYMMSNFQRRAFTDKNPGLARILGYYECGLYNVQLLNCKPEFKRVTGTTAYINVRHLSKLPSDFFDIQL